MAVETNNKPSPEPLKKTEVMKTPLSAEQVVSNVVDKGPDLLRQMEDQHRQQKSAVEAKSTASKAELLASILLGQNVTTGQPTSVSDVPKTGNELIDGLKAMFTKLFEGSWLAGLFGLKPDTEAPMPLVSPANLPKSSDVKTGEANAKSVNKVENNGAGFKVSEDDRKASEAYLREINSTANPASHIGEIKVLPGGDKILKVDWHHNHTGQWGTSSYREIPGRHIGVQVEAAPKNTPKS